MQFRVPETVFLPRRIFWFVIVGLLMLPGCQTTDMAETASRFLDAVVSPGASSPSPVARNGSPKDSTASASGKVAAENADALSPAPDKGQRGERQPSKPVSWGLVSLIVGAGGPYGDDWYLQVLPTEKTRNFIGVRSPELTIADSQMVQLWPGSYIVRVIHNSKTKFDTVLDIGAGEWVRLTAEYGYFLNSVKSETLAVHNDQVLTIGTHVSRLSENYRPLIVAQDHDWRFEFHGPRINDEVTGPGPVTILKNGKPVAEIPDATITALEITGTVRLRDGGTYPGRFDRQKIELLGDPADIKVVWNNGQTFEGTFDGPLPTNGTLKRISGSVWTGDVADGHPTGKGRMTRPDGSWIAYDNYRSRDLYTGTRPCGSTPTSRETCFFHKGEQLDSEAELTARLVEDKRLAEEKRRSQQLASTQAATVQQYRQAANQPDADQNPQHTASAQKAHDCTTASGTFTADGNLTTYTMYAAGRGSGHFRQLTYGGREQYQFDIDFRFTTTPNSIDFRYDEGIYRDVANGAILRRTSIPGGQASCHYDGQILTINGKQFIRN